MHLSRLFPQTLHQAPAGAEQASHALLLRAGLVRPLGPATFAWLPLGQRVRRRLQDLAWEALDALGGQEIALPALLPAEALEPAGLSPQVAGPAWRDRAGRSFFWPQTLAALLTGFLRHDLRSHRLLPLLLYAFRSRFQEGERPAGPLNARQSLFLEVASFQPDAQGLARSSEELRQACEQIFRRCGLPVVAAEATVEPGGFLAAEFVVPQVPGDTPFARCGSCGYTANLDVACRAKEDPPAEEPLPLEEVATPGCHTIAALSGFLGVPESRTAKAVFLVSGERFFFVIVRGDMEVNEARLARLVGAQELRPAQEQEISALGASPGYASPLGIRRAAPEAGLRQVLIVVDDLIPRSPNLVAGANKEDTHLRNVNCGRDYTPDRVGDLVKVRPGDPCPHCRAPLERLDSTVLGRLWSPGSAHSEVLGATFLDGEGRERPLLLACAEIALDRTIAACVELHHDEAGIRWPRSLAPYAVYLLTIGDAPEVQEAAGALDRALQAAGVPILLDDRAESAGRKFADADLLGLPLRVAVSRRTVQQQAAEVKRRDQPREATQVIPLGEVVAWVQRELAE